MSAPTYFDLDVARQIGGTFTGRVTWTDNNFATFGTGSDANIWYDGTDLIVDPATVGSGVFRNGALTTDQRNFYTYRLGLGDTVPTSGALVQATTTSSVISGIFSATLTHTGTTATMRTMLFTAVHQGTQTGNQTAIGAVFTGQIDTDSSTATRNGIGVQGASGFTGSRTQSQGTSVFQSMIAKTPTAGGSHTGGTIRSYGLYVEPEASFAGSATVGISVAAHFQGTVHIVSDKKLILEGSSTSAGDSYFVFNSSTTDIDCFVDNTKTQTWDNDQIDFFVNLGVADATNIILGTTTGTKIGTATTQKLGFYNATPVVQQTDGANLTNNVTSGGTTDTIADFTSLTIYATDAATIRNDIYQLARKVKIIGDALRTYGLLS